MKKAIMLLLLATTHITTQSIINYAEGMNLYKKNFDSLEGWFFTQMIDVLIVLDELQHKKGITGNLAEIGVFHGKSFISLYLLSNANDRVLAVDCFDDQQFNYDNSGPGCKEESFRKNIKDYCDPELLKLDTLRGDSSKMTAQHFIDTCNNGRKFRMFSVDGCHKANETEIDVKNAYQALERGGVLIIDDFFRPYWPGVASAVSKFLIENTDIKPFFIGFNKILLTHKEFTDEYREELKKPFKPLKEEIFFDSVVAIYSQ